MEESEAVGCVDGGLAVPCAGFAEGGHGLAADEGAHCGQYDDSEEEDGDELFRASHGGFYRSIGCLDTTRGEDSIWSVIQ